MKKRSVKKEPLVISLGGSLIIPSRLKGIDFNFLTNFKKLIKKHKKKYKFIIVCGGGNLAREYISALEKEKVSSKFKDLAGVSATRTNARFVSYFFNKPLPNGLPSSIKEVTERATKSDLVFSGALKYLPKRTTDSNAAEISKNIGSKFINLTDVDGLYNKNPKKFSKAELIKEISWKDFYTLTKKRKFKPGQHFILDKNAAKIIKDNKIKTYILGKDLKELDNLLNGKNFKGTTINK